MKVLMKLSQIHIIKERKTKAHNDTMGQDIENIGTYETITKVNTTKWRPIYEVIDEAYIKESNIFPDYFIREFKTIQKNHYLYQVTKKNNIKRMAMEQILYAQVVKLLSKD